MRNDALILLPLQVIVKVILVAGGDGLCRAAIRDAPKRGATANV